MKAECRDWRESLGALALGHLADEERLALEAHLDGCPECRLEAQALGSVAKLLPHADPSRFETAPVPPAALAGRVVAAIGAERRKAWLRRLRFRVTLAGATAAVAAAALAIFLLPGGGESSPSQKVTFGSLPTGMKIAATLEPRAFGTEIHMYVNGVPSGTLCRVFVRGRAGSRLSAGSFMYRWGGKEEAVLSSALDLSRTSAIGVRVGDRTFVAPVPQAEASRTDNHPQEEAT
jgi:putative zinc finger protein